MNLWLVKKRRHSCIHIFILNILKSDESTNLLVIGHSIKTEPKIS